MAVNQIEIDECFDRIWPSWLNKTNPHAAKKALGVKLRMPGVRMDMIELACSIYVEEHRGQEFTHQLNNYLIQDLYVDTLQGTANPEEYKALLERERDLAIACVHDWNHHALPHWSKVLDIEERISIAKKALANDFFKKNWKIALDKATRIFQYKAREGSPYAKLILSFQWFCNVASDKHTVLKILEGGYGEPERPLYLGKRPDSPSQELTKENLIEFYDDWLEVFGTKHIHDKRSDGASKKDDSPW